MLQYAATLISCVIATGALALIAAILIDDWAAVVRALRGGHSTASLNLPVSRVDTQPQVRNVPLNRQFAPKLAAA